MHTMTRTIKSKARVQYQDCDPFNHLNNSRYIDYIMGARTEQLLDNYGFDVSELADKHRLGWVSAQTQIAYFVPASWMEIVTIETRLIQFSESSLLVEGLMWDEHEATLKSLMWAKLVHFTIDTQRSCKHSQELMKFLSTIHFPLEETRTFEERAKTIRRLNRAL